MDELLPIGRFARLSGISIGALRHYDERGLLAPARVDPETGYRSYRRDQLEAARLILRLRDLEMPLPAIRAVLAADPARRTTLLAEHRARLQSRTWRLHGALHQLDALTRTEASMTALVPTLTAEDHRRLGVDLFNHVWTLLELPERTPEQVDEMIHAAHASRHHWAMSGPAAEPYRLVVGEWQCSRVYAVLGRAEPSLHHAGRALELCERHRIGDWQLASAHEAMARASAVAGDRASAEHHARLARQVAATITDDDDREVVTNDLATLPLG